MAQGNHRYERSIIYFNYLQYYFSSEILGRHQHAIIPNIDHDSYNIFNSACGRKALFGYGDCDQLDFLNVSLYKDIKNEDHLNTLIQKEPMWTLLEHTEFVEQLFHVGEHGSILRKMKPKNVEQLAMILAIIRPGKRHLLGKTWKEVNETIWKKPTTNEYYFKKAHAVAYAMAIVVQMNLICEGLLDGEGRNTSSMSNM